MDRDLLHLIKMGLKVPVAERDENGRMQITGGKKKRPVVHHKAGLFSAPGSDLPVQPALMHTFDLPT